QELAPGGRVVEEVAYFDRRAEGARGRPHVGGDASFAGERVAVVAAGRPRRDGEPRHRRDARQRLAAKTERRERLEVVERRDLARRVPRQREREPVPRDAAALVRHADELGAAGREVYRDRAGARVERVLDELLDDGGRPLDDLACRDLVDELRRKNSNGHPRTCSGAVASDRAALTCGQSTPKRG